MRARNPYSSIDDDPITRADVQEVRDSLCNFWEDTRIVTEPNHYPIITVGNLRAMLDTLLRCKDFDSPQIMMDVRVDDH